MINISATNEYNEEIVTLWQESFGDTVDDIQFFLDNCKHMNCLTLKDNGELSSMLFLVDCKVDFVEYKYIYAACTSKKFRGLGYMSRLLNYCKSNIGNVLLIPADEGLVKYYTNRAFNHKIEINSIIFNESDDIKEYLLEGCRLSEPFALACNGVE